MYAKSVPSRGQLWGAARGAAWRHDPRLAFSTTSWFYSPVRVRSGVHQDVVITKLFMSILAVTHFNRIGGCAESL